MLDTIVNTKYKYKQRSQLCSVCYIITSYSCIIATLLQATAIDAPSDAVVTTVCSHYYMQPLLQYTPTSVPLSTVDSSSLLWTLPLSLSATVVTVVTTVVTVATILHKHQLLLLLLLLLTVVVTATYCCSYCYLLLQLLLLTVIPQHQFLLSPL